MRKHLKLTPLLLLLALPLIGCAPAPGNPTSTRNDLAPPQAPPSLPLPSGLPPSVTAKSSLVIDGVTGRILAGKAIHDRRAIASTQKLLTALVVVNAGSLDKMVTITSSDTQVEPTKLYLKVGETHTRRDLLRVLLVKSANDVARALARDVGGSQEGFAKLMNQRARSIGMMNSHFINPHGLTEEGQFSTASDLAILARAAYRHSFIRSCTRLRSITFRHNDGRVKKLNNTNKLLKRIDYVTGMKTGTTRASGKCLVSSGELNGRLVIVVMLGSTSQKVWDDSTNLLRWALETTPQAAASRE
jgi:D-alanyl-D-alanine carboxypeptidase (penicillin-binding protein 5/6)